MLSPRQRADEGPAHAKLTSAYARQLAEIVALVDEHVISGKTAKDLFAELAPGVSPRQLVEERGLRQHARRPSS